jgi:hypothetical protein
MEYRDVLKTRLGGVLSAFGREICCNIYCKIIHEYASPSSPFLFLHVCGGRFNPRRLAYHQNLQQALAVIFVTSNPNLYLRNKSAFHAVALEPCHINLTASSPYWQTQGRFFAGFR